MKENKTSKQALTDAELNEKIRSLQSKSRLFKILAMITVGIIVITVISSGIENVSFGLTFALVIAAVVFLMVGLYNGSLLKDFISDNIVKQSVEAVFDEATYVQNKHISDSNVAVSRMGLPHYDRVDGNDYVVGKYKGLSIEMSDVTLVVEEVSTDDDGNEQRNDRDVFKGLWLICDFEKELSADMRLWEWGGLRHKDKGIITDNEAFNKLFRIESEVEVEAFYILTPHMMEYILGVKDKARGQLHMCFSRNGKVQIAIDSGRDSFEAGKETDAAALRARFVREIRYVTDIIDELRLVDTLYK